MGKLYSTKNKGKKKDIKKESKSIYVVAAVSILVNLVSVVFHYVG